MIRSTARAEALRRLKEAINGDVPRATQDPKSVIKELGTLESFVSQEDFERLLDEVASEDRAKVDWSPKFDPKQ